MYKEIVFDLDNTLNDTVSNVLKHYNLNYNASLSIEDIKTYKLIHNYGEEVGNELLRLFNDKVAYDTPMIYDGAEELIAYSLKVAQDVSIWTLCNNSEIISVKKDFVAKAFGIRCDTCIGTHKPKRMIQGVFVDDYIENINSVEADLKILLTQPWNIGYNSTDFIRANSLRDVLDIIAYRG